MNERHLFTDALAMPQQERGGYLDEACGADPALRERLEQLLAVHENGHSLLEKRPAEMLAAMSDKNDRAETDLTSAEASARQLAIFLAPSTRPDALGRLAHYEVLQVLGQGGFGIVVKAFDESLHRMVAIKVLAPHLALTSPPRKRFLREARAAAQVRHEHVVQIYAVEEKPLPYLVMEFIEGQTLQQKLDATGPLDAPEAVRLGQQVAMGLAAAHEQGLIHRDVTPANILLPSGPTPCVKLTDFGLARTSDDASLTASGVIAGTPMYMSPEQARGVQLDHRADLFSLGSVLYTVTTGHPPFRAATTLDVLRRVAEDTPRPIRQVMDGVPPGLCAVINRLLEKDPKDRFATARDAADALGRSLTDGHRVAPDDRFRRRVWQGAALVAAALLVFATAAWLAGGHAASGKLARSLNEPPLTDGGKPAGESSMPQAATSGAPPGFVVTSVLDDDSDGTLRWAIREANLHPGEDCITFDRAVFASPQTITLSQGPLMLTDPSTTTIRGPAGGLTLSGNHKSQVFVIGAGNEVPPHAAQASIADLTIAHGQTTDEFQGGGGVLVVVGSTLTLTGCTLRDNKALHENQGGGAVLACGSLLSLVNCTLAHNESVEGGGIKNYDGTAKVINCTFFANDSNLGAGIYTGGYNRARTEIFNSLFADSGIGPEMQQVDGIITGDYNLSRDASAPGPHSQHHVNFRLGPLGRHGGPTETVVLLTGGPGMGVGDPERVPPDIGTDQRGLPRFTNGKVDMGAFQVQGASFEAKSSATAQ